jgi:hypothetical protein
VAAFYEVSSLLAFHIRLLVHVDKKSPACAGLYRFKGVIVWVFNDNVG